MRGLDTSNGRTTVVFGVWTTWAAFTPDRSQILSSHNFPDTFNKNTISDFVGLEDDLQQLKLVVKL